ncbi:LuxR C-terminal-related transcriptional regulator [Streptomyces gamaensis]|uniref:LuxR C-terminal-related transcriptional regulator n=1 Tax=Streptomyces gamaensis TaxID=1763542 RepID=A0ABW0YXU0_9ACTN
MARREACGTPDQAFAVYQRLRAHGTADLGAAARELGLDARETGDAAGELTRLGLIAPAPAGPADGAGEHGGSAEPVTAVAPEVALLRVLQREQRALHRRLHEADQAYTALEALTERYLRSGSPGEAAVEVEILTDYGRIHQVLEELTEVVREDISSMHPGALPTGEFLAQGLERDRRLLASGARVRTINNQRLAAIPPLRDYFHHQTALGVEVRLAPVVPVNMILGDRRFALLPLDPEDQRAGAILARGPALVRSYLTMYEYCWHTSSPFDGGAETERGGDGLTEQQRAAVRMLASGMKDEKIARNLGVSLRTVSRLLSEVMQVLGASSRFEAGVKATRMGWLD